MLVIFECHDEVIVCEVDNEGNPIGDKQFFEEADRDREDYTRSVVEGPVQIEISVKAYVSPERELS